MTTRLNDLTRGKIFGGRFVNSTLNYTWSIDVLIYGLLHVASLLVASTFVL